MGVEPAHLSAVGGRHTTSFPDRVDSNFENDRVDHSLIDDVETLIADGKTYLEAEIAFQKSRAGFAVGSVKSATIYGLGALAFLHLALIALVVGLVIALAPIIGAWLATAAVTGLLLLGACLMVRRLQARVADLMQVFGGKE